MKLTVNGNDASFLLSLIRRAKAQNPEGMTDQDVADRITTIMARWDEGGLSDMERWEMQKEVDQLGYLHWPVAKERAFLGQPNSRKEMKRRVEFERAMDLNRDRRTNNDVEVTIIIEKACNKCCCASNT